MNESGLTEYFRSRRVVLFDSALGTALMAAGMKPGTGSEEMNFISPEIVTAIHRENLIAGSDIITSNTFGATQMYLRGDRERALESVRVAVGIARQAALEFEDKLVCFGLGPAGLLLGPLGDKSYEESEEAYAALAAAGARAGADFILLETFADKEEIIRAACAAKDASGLPIAGTMTFEESGRSYMGAAPADFVRAARACGFTALGANCQLGPSEMSKIISEIIEEAKESPAIPVIAQPNAGRPHYENGKTVYKISAEDFAEGAKQLIDLGVSAIGGCCGTTPEMISLIRGIINDRRK